jgi:hypothetical protein
MDSWKQWNARVFIDKLETVDATYGEIRQLAQQWNAAGFSKMDSLWIDGCFELCQGRRDRG